MNFKPLSQIWGYFKTGKSEVGIVLGLYTLALTYSIRYDSDFTGTQYLLILSVFFVVCVFLGVFVAEKILPENQKISPYSQDSIKCAMDFQIAMMYSFDGDIVNAKKHMQRSLDRWSKWLKVRDEFEFLFQTEDMN